MKRQHYAGLAIIMAVTYQLLLIILIFIRPDLPPYSTTISEWAIGKFGWLMQTAFFCSALSYFFLWMSVKNDIHGTWGKIGLILLLLCATGTAVVGTFVTDPYPPDFTITTTLLHTIGGAMGMVLLPCAALLINYNLVHHAMQGTKAKPILKLSGFLPLIAFIGFIVHLNLFVAPLGKDAVGEHVPIGYPPRIRFLTYHVWLTILAIIVIQFKPSKTYHYDI